MEGILKRAKSEGYLSSDCSDVIITLDLGLDIGDIQKPLINDERKNLLEASYYSDLWSIPDNKEFLQHWERVKKAYERFSLLVQAGGAARVWYSDAPGSLCGYMYVMSELSKSTCELRAVHLPRYSDGDVSKPLIDWGNVPPNALQKHLKYERKIYSCERNAVSFLWKKLKEENTSLRASVNGYMIGVPETFYDSFILSKIDNSPFEVADLILRILHSFPLGIGSFIIATRLKEMIQLGILDIYSKKSRFYNSILQKT